MVARNQATILQRAAPPTSLPLPPEAANWLLQFSFSADDRARMKELVQLHNEGRLNGEAVEELENYRRVALLLDLVHARALRAINEKRNPA
jgi:ferric-dicitrate binding protein FerR (iron transport regulator)